MSYSSFSSAMRPRSRRDDRGREDASNRGLIFYVGSPGSTPALLPRAYREQSRRCVTDACLVVYGVEVNQPSTNETV